MPPPSQTTLEDEWLLGCDSTPGIVSVWADGDGRATVWRRIAATGALLREEARFRPWLLVDFGVFSGLASNPRVSWREADGPGALRYVVSADSLRTLRSAVLHEGSRRLGRRVDHLRELGKEHVLALPPEEQYLVATGRTYFRDLTFDHLRRLQVDLETTGLDPERDRIFMIAVRDPSGVAEILEAGGEGDAAEAALIARLVARVQAADPDVIENHNLHGFDLPFLDRRARRLGVPLALGRIGPPGLRQRAARRGIAQGEGEERRRVRLVAPGRELIDTMDAVMRHAFATSELRGHGLKAVARHFGLAGPDREHIRGDLIYDVYRRDPARVRRYATADVEEVAGLSRMLGGAAFALARMAPRRYERLADAGAATGVIDPLLVRAYLRSNTALPAHQPGDGTPHSGAALHLFASGVARRVVKADVASLYPSLMRAYRIGPARDRLGALLALLEADTDGVYFAVPETWTEADERRVVADVAALLPPLVQLEFEGRYRAMLSHEPKNYALLAYDGTLVLKGVGFRSSRAEPFGEAFLRASLARLLVGDVTGVRDVYLAAVVALRRRELPTFDVSSRVRLTRTPEEYLAIRENRRELTYEALLAGDRTSWTVGDRVRVYRTETGYGGLVADPDEEGGGPERADRRDYDADHYVRVLRDTFAARLARAFTPGDFDAVFADPGQPSLFPATLATTQTVLTPSGSGL